MMKTKTTFKGLLLAALLLGGAGSAWADTSKKVIYRQNYATGAIGNYWTSSNGSIQSDATHGRYARIQGDGSTYKKPKYGYTQFQDATLDWTGVTSYSVEFDLSIENTEISKGYTGELALMDSKTTANFYQASKDHSGTSFCKNSDGTANSNAANNLFYMAVKNETTFTVQNKSKDVTITSGKWYHYKFDVTVATGEVSYTISDPEGIQANQSDSYTVSDGSTFYCTGIFLFSGRDTGNGSNIDNILITTEVDGDYANTPALALVGVTGTNGTSRIFEITGVAGETVKYKIGDAGLENNYSAPVTVAKDEKLIAWTTKGGATSITISQAITGDAVSPTPTVTMIALREGEEKRYTYTATRDNTTVTEGSYLFEVKPTLFYATSSSATSGTDVDKTKKWFSVDANGTYYLIWKADGCETKVSSAFTNTGCYVKTNIFDFKTISASDLETTYGITKDNTYGYNFLDKIVTVGNLQFTANDQNNSYLLHSDKYLYRRNEKNSGYSKLTVTDLQSNQYAVLVAKSGDEIGDTYIYGGTTNEFSIPKSIDYEFLEYYIPAAKISACDNLGYTFSSTLPLDFTDTDVEAYIATYTSGNTVSLKRVNKVPANTGLFIKSSSSLSNVSIPTTTAATDDVTGNVLVAQSTTGNVAQTADTKTNYVLALVDKDDESKGISFLMVPDAGVSVGAGKAYLSINYSSVAPSRLTVVFEDETTGIRSLTPVPFFASEASQAPSAPRGEGSIYTLDGRRVTQPTKGLYIVNGKKVVIK